MNQRRHRLALATGTLISAVFLWLALRGLQPEEFWKSLGDISLPWLLAATLVYFAAVAVIALRWQFLLRALKFVPLAPLTKLVFIGYMGNNVYPLRAGDALRIILLRRQYGVPILSSTAIVATERIIDGCVMLAFLLFSLLLIEVESTAVEAILGLSTPLFAVALLVALLLAAKPNLLRAVVYPTLNIFPPRISAPLTRFADDALAGLEGLRHPTHFLGALASSILTWAIEAFTYWLVMHAFGLELSYAVALLLVGAVNLAGLIPASPGQVGVNEFVVISILTALEIDASLATTCAIVIHIVIWLPITVAGFALLLKQGMGWADIGRARKIESAETLGAEAG